MLKVSFITELSADDGCVMLQMKLRHPVVINNVYAFNLNYYENE